jgi:hypothetical protein
VNSPPPNPTTGVAMGVRTGLVTRLPLGATAVLVVGTSDATLSVATTVIVGVPVCADAPPGMAASMSANTGSSRQRRVQVGMDGSEEAPAAFAADT